MVKAEFPNLTGQLKVDGLFKKVLQKSNWPCKREKSMILHFWTIQYLQILFIMLRQEFNIVNAFVVANEIHPINKRTLHKIIINIRITPIDWNRPAQKSPPYFLRTVTWDGIILISNKKLIPGRDRNVPFHPGVSWDFHVVKNSTGTIQWQSRHELFSKIDTLNSILITCYKNTISTFRRQTQLRPL